MIELFRRYKAINKLFSRESEFDLAYLHGRGIEFFPQIKNSKVSVFEGGVISCYRFFREVINNLFLSKTDDHKADVVFFSNTVNQYNTTCDIYEELVNQGVSCAKIATRNINRNVDYVKLKLSDLVLVLFFLLKRGGKIYWKLNHLSNNRFNIKYLFFYWVSYFYCVNFYRYLYKKDIKLLVMSNDHNVENRVLRLICEDLGIETLYIQHATSPGNLPPLNFDYAFLDGLNAFNDYLISQGGTPVSKKTKIYLSGIIKRLSQPMIKSNVIVGVAMNSYDDLDSVAEFINRLGVYRQGCIIRAHPAQRKEDMQKLSNLGVEISYGSTEPVNDFFDKISVLIGGNSSIHIEAASSGIATLYKEFGESTIPSDYYSFVKNGVSLANYEDISVEKDISISLRNKDSKSRVDSISQYNASYLTSWKNNEYRLVSESILCIINNLPMKHFIASDDYYVIAK
ncbi:hypothetical protein KI743_12420 [Vibrio sp. D420a]|uniref:hypothetical protein n=1 Tax=Vibrio sp. D420a TaxID=2836895 RepID=UPI0025567318|nr:hypothetical protein [Vibrio sp. D420a]MDK9762808.1 hypothetical protein [Vibrio sp. D420a]